MEQLKIATVFSGIGAFEQALNKLKIPYRIVFACDNGERELKSSKNEILSFCQKNNFNDDETNNYVKQLYNSLKQPNWMKKAYFANYEISENNWYEDIRFINGKKYFGKVDIFVGGSPCQSFSIIGKKAGLEDARGTLFYEYARLVNEIQPKVFIYENVPGMLVHDKGKTWQTIQQIFMSLGYKIFVKVLNAKDYGIPQDRKRLFVIGFKDQTIKFEFPPPKKLTTTLFDYLQKDVDPKYYLGKKGFKFVTNPKYKNRARVNHEIIQTQKANQQFNWNGDFVFEKLNLKRHNKAILQRAYVAKYKNVNGVIRQLTHRECLNLMGFSQKFKIVVPNVWAYRQAGNSIVVNVLEEITKQIFKFLRIKHPLKVATVFSGIGSIEFALKRLKIDYQIIFACDNGEREINYDEQKEKKKVFSLKTIKAKKDYIDKLYHSHTSSKNYVKESYFANYDIDPDRWFEDIKLLDGRDFKGQVDLFVGGSPCQSFSSVGSKKGLDDTRGTLFYEFARLVNQIKPNVFIYENVRNLINHDHGKTWAKIKQVFDELGYTYKFAILNSADYGIPQNRRRLFVVGYRKNTKFNFPPKTKTLEFELKDFLIENCDFGYCTSNKNGDLILQKKKGPPQTEYLLSPKIYNYVMKGGTKTFYSKPEINKKIARTLLKTMGNRHRAGVDNYVSLNGKKSLGSVRMLTERECHRLMGYTDDYRIVVSKAQAYKQAGNSIVVDVMMSILKEIFNNLNIRGE